MAFRTFETNQKIKVMPSPGRKKIAGRPPKKGQKEKVIGPTRSRGRPRKQDRAGAPVANKNAERFTEEYVIDLLDSMYRYATHSSGPNKSGQPYFNPVRANDIKLFKELCLCVGINSVQFSEIQEKFCRKYISVGNQQDSENERRLNPNFSPIISEKVQVIKDICECRLSYSGQFIDTFLLKNHYGMTDKTDITSQGEKLPAPVAPVINIIEQL